MDSVFEKYRDALTEAGPRLKELILHRAEQDAGLSFDDFLTLCKIAYPMGNDTF